VKRGRRPRIRHEFVTGSRRQIHRKEIARTEPRGIVDRSFPVQIFPSTSEHQLFALAEVQPGRTHEKLLADAGPRGAAIMNIIEHARALAAAPSRDCGTVIDAGRSFRGPDSSLE
jgi:hypothetical protein